MLIYTFGRLYYLAGLSWLLALALLAAGPAAAYVLYWRDGPPLLPAASLRSSTTRSRARSCSARCGRCSS